MTLVFCAPAYIVVSGRHGNNLRIAGDFYVNVVEFGLLPVVEAWSVSKINFAGVDFDIGSDLRGDLSKTSANLNLLGCDHLTGRVRSQERRVGKECGQKCRSRWSQYN